MAFSFLSLVLVSLNIFQNISVYVEMVQTFLPGATNWNTSVSRHEIEVFDPQAWQSCLRHDTWQVYPVTTLICGVHLFACFNSDKKNRGYSSGKRMFRLNTAAKRKPRRHNTDVSLSNSLNPLIPQYQHTNSPDWSPKISLSISREDLIKDQSLFLWPFDTFP